MLTKEHLLLIIRERGQLLLDYSDARDIFGMKRIDGLEFALKKWGNPSLSEKQASYTGPAEMEASLKQWCLENNLFFHDRAVTYQYYIAAREGRN